MGRKSRSKPWRQRKYVITIPDRLFHPLKNHRDNIARKLKLPENRIPLHLCI